MIRARHGLNMALIQAVLIRSDPFCVMSCHVMSLSYLAGRADGQGKQREARLGEGFCCAGTGHRRVMSCNSVIY